MTEPNPTPLGRAELEAELRLFKTFAQAAPPVAEQLGSTLLHLSRLSAGFLDGWLADPEASPTPMLLAAGEAQAGLEALRRVLGSAIDQLDRLPFRLDPGQGEAGTDAR